MGELKRLLEPVAMGTGGTVDPFGPLDRRRRQRERNKRLRAGFLAALIAVGGTVFAVQAFGGEGTPTVQVGTHAPAFDGVWPELTLEGATVVQEQADAGDPDVAWRLDATEVSGSLGEEVFGEIGAITPADGAGDPDEVLVSIQGAPVPCPSPTDGEPLAPTCLPRIASLTLERLVRPGEGGIWSVTSMGSDRITIDLDAAAIAIEGSKVAISVDAPQGTTAFLGISGTDGSPTRTCQLTPLEGGRPQTFEVRVQPCGDAMYLWGLIAFGTLDQIVGEGTTGEDLPTPFDGEPVLALAVTPLHLTSSTAAPSLEPSPEPQPTGEPSPSDRPNGGSITDVVDVTCTVDGASLASAKVLTQADGVHVRVSDPAGTSDSFYATLQGRDDGHFDTIEGHLSGAVTDFVVPYPPGDIFVACATDQGGTRPPSELVRLQVVDRDDFWISDELRCPVSEQIQAGGFRDTVGAVSPREDTAEAAIRLHVPGVLDGDEVLIAEYGQPTPSMDQVWMVVRREGRVLAHFQVNGHDGTWGVHWGNTCKGSGVADGGDQPVNGSTLGF